MTPNQLPPLPEPFALSVSVHDGDTPAKTYVECLLYQKHPNEKQRLYTADQMHAYALAAIAQQAQEPVAWLYVDTVGERYLCFSRPTGGGAITNLYATPQPQPAPHAGETTCGTCNGHGLIGGHLPDGSGYGEPCPDCNAPQVPAPVDERHRAVALELDRLMLVIESAVRWQDPTHHAAVLSLLKANRAALQSPAPKTQGQP